MERFGIKLGLETTRELLTVLGDPQEKYPVVLVAGTNGKGSTVALLYSMLRAAGYRTGRFVSPHLESPCERLCFDGRPIGDAELAELLEYTIEAGRRALGHPPSYFEALCIGALEWFSRREVEIAVVEVGLGGRLDATNVCEPAISIITSIGLDHQRLLGDTVAEIAVEKAGILRPGRPAVTACQGPALRAIRSVAEELAAPLEIVDPAGIRVVEEGVGGQVVEIPAGAGRRRLRLALAGEHQRVNAALAAQAAEILVGRGFGRLSGAAIETGAARCRWPGRCELVELANGGSVLLDVAHNLDGALALAGFLERHYPRYVLLFGALRGKRATEMVAALMTGALRVVLTRPPSTRARPPADLANALNALTEEVDVACGLDVAEDPERALDLALERAAAEGSGLVVCGSLYLVGEIRRRLSRRFGVPEPLSPAPGDQPSG